MTTNESLVSAATELHDAVDVLNRILRDTEWNRAVIYFKTGDNMSTGLDETSSSESGGSKMQQDYLYISNDPDENADNFDPKWASLREMRTDEERYRAIRKRWGNSNLPDPKINLTCRHSRNESEVEAKENCFNSPNPVANCSKKKTKASRRRSRSCTRPYEQLMSNLQRNYELEYSWLIYKHKVELEEIHQVQLMQTYLYNGLFNYDMMERLSLERQQKEEVFHLLSNHYNEVQNFIGKKNENIDACKRYMQEVKSFFNLYQKINDDEVTVQMTDDQYEHTVETEKMYSLYSMFYN